MLSRISLKVKLTTIVVTLVAIGVVVFARFTSIGLSTMLDKAAGSGVRTAAAVLADQVDTAWLMTVQPSSSNDATYQQLSRKLKALVTGGYVTRVELVRFPEKNTVEHLINFPVDGSSDYFSPGTIEAVVGGSLYAQDTDGYHVWTSDNRGRLMVGWVPIVQRGGRIGQLIVFMDVNDVQGTITTINMTVDLVMLLLVFLAGVLTYKFAAGFEKVAVTDGLMGIYNRKYFNQRLEQEVARSKRYAQLTSLVMMDIDFFKRINDTYGHATGDITLKNLAKWVSDSIRSTDVVCRYGGEEIGVILTHTGIAGAQEFAERLRLKISQQYVKDPGEGVEFRVTVSMGVAQWEKGLEYIDLVKRADAALYHSKHTGRNRVTIYTDDIQMEPEKPSTRSGSDRH